MNLKEKIIKKLEMIFLEEIIFNFKEKNISYNLNDLADKIISTDNAELFLSSEEIYRDQYRLNYDRYITYDGFDTELEEYINYNEIDYQVYITNNIFIINNDAIIQFKTTISRHYYTNDIETKLDFIYKVRNAILENKEKEDNKNSFIKTNKYQLDDILNYIKSLYKYIGNYRSDCLYFNALNEKIFKDKDFKYKSYLDYLDIIKKAP